MYEFLLTLNVVIYLAVGVWYLRQPACSIYHPMTYYLLFHGLVFTVRPIFAWFYGFHQMYDLIGFQPTEWERSTALICTIVSLLTFAAVCMAVGGQRMQFGTKAEDDGRRMALLRSFWPIAVVLAALGLWSVLSGLNTLATSDPNEWRKIDARTGAMYLVGQNGYFMNLAMLLPPIVAIIPYLARFRWWSLLPFAFYAFLNLGTGGRGQVVTASIMVGLLYLLTQRRKWPSVTILPLLAAGWMVFSFIGQDRGEGIRASLGYGEVTTVVAPKVEEKPLESMDLANMEFLEMLVWAVPKRTGTYEYFVHNLQIFTEPIPRALWPGKPVGPPIQMYQLYRYAVPLGATSSIAGMGWQAAGYVGVMIWTALFGAIFGLAYRSYVRSGGGVVASVLYIITIAISPIIYRDGSIMSMLKFIQFYYIPVIALAIVAYYIGNSRVGAGLAGSPALGAMTGRERRRMRASGATASGRAAEPVPAEQGRVEAYPGSPRARRLARAAGLPSWNADPAE